MSQLWKLTAHEMLTGLEAREFSSRELVDSCLTRIDEVNPTVNAIAEVCADDARTRAKAIDAARVAGLELPQLAGLPYTAKLDYDVAGQATSQGTIARKDAIADHDSPMIERVRAAGAILLGRTNQSDFGILYHAHSALYGATVNPWDASRSPGGSSGGEGAAVASGMSPLGLGSDIGGSIRGPASFGGIAGLKPGFGHYPYHDQFLQEPPVHEQFFTGRGPLARSVRDLRIADAVLRGADPRDPWSAPQNQQRPQSRTIGMIVNPGYRRMPVEVEAAIRSAGVALVDAGWEVVETEIPNTSELIDTYTEIMATGFGGSPDTWDTLQELTVRFLTYIGKHDLGNAGAVTLTELMGRRHRLGVQFNAFHKEFAALITPTWADLPFVAATIGTDEGIRESLLASRHMWIWNLLGLPAASIPCGLASGLPVGVHVSALRFQESLVLDIADDIENRLGRLAPIDPR